jgi:creatinine amidohydrolase
MELISVMLEENNRRVIRKAIAAGTLRAAIVPAGSTEQHNEHLAMNHDTRSVVLVARKAAENLWPSVVVTPPLTIGVSEHWMDHPGTLTLTPKTFCQVLLEICGSLRRHDVKNILVLNGHGGNRQPIVDELPRLRQHLGIPLDFCSYWEAYSPEVIEQYLSSRECPAHAAEFETSFALAAFPESVSLSDEPYPVTELHISDPRRAEADRRYHRDARLAKASTGQPMIDIAVDWLTRRLKAMLRWEAG